MSIDARQQAEQMVLQQLRDRGINDEKVLQAMARVPRHRFIPEVEVQQAYSDHALPTAEGQTISQPYMVARMTQALDVHEGSRILEIGTGSGYQTAVLLELGAEVVSIERFPSLAQRARQVLAELYSAARFEVHLGDGTLGQAARAPYQGVIVTAGAPRVPQAYLDQLADPGRIVIPLGDRTEQVLTVVTIENGQRRDFRDVPCRFVPLVGADGWPEQ